MKKLTDYDINLVKLKDKKHEYDFDLKDDFFSLFDQTLVNGGDLIAHVELDKSPLLITLNINITGSVNLTCDRSLEEFDYPVNIKQNLLIKFGDEEIELDENVLQIPHDAQTLNMAQHLFDFIGLAIPMKKLHPRFEVDYSEEGDILIYSTGTSPDAEGETDTEKEASVDPRWDILKNLSKN